MYVYQEKQNLKTSEKEYAVGFFDAKGFWDTESIHPTRESAAKRVNYLNGGSSLSKEDFAEVMTMIRTAIDKINGPKKELPTL